LALGSMNFNFPRSGMILTTFVVVGAVVGGFVLPFILHHALLPFGLEWLSSWGVSTGGYVISAHPYVVSQPWLTRLPGEAYRQLQALPFFGALSALTGILVGIHATMTKRLGSHAVAAFCGSLPGLPLVLATVRWTPHIPSGNAMMDKFMRATAWTVPFGFFVQFVVSMALAASVAMHIVRRWHLVP
jgi:hypothetical protein